MRKKAKRAVSPAIRESSCATESSSIFGRDTTPCTVVPVQQDLITMDSGLHQEPDPTLPPLPDLRDSVQGGNSSFALFTSPIDGFPPAPTPSFSEVPLMLAANEIGASAYPNWGGSSLGEPGPSNPSMTYAAAHLRLPVSAPAHSSFPIPSPSAAHAPPPLPAPPLQHSPPPLHHALLPDGATPTPTWQVGHPYHGIMGPPPSMNPGSSLAGPVPSGPNMFSYPHQNTGIGPYGQPFLGQAQLSAQQQQIQIQMLQAQLMALQGNQFPH